ncbi:SIS domain-containing protein [Usitatibacter rugosus]|uniref:SIS domain-containing protein n=1 Tax=Usitatibacter rugosus TaxID=2732067 RepID=UPI001BB1BCD5|nr:SIS domain-containing protein [Usitatibacter rugosus]
MSANAIDPGSTQLFQEAAQASDAVRLQFERTHSAALALGSALRTLKPRAVVTCARGSSDHAATFAKYLIETRTGVLTASAAPSVSSVYGARQDMRDVLFLAISQSGRSPDLVSATAAAKQAGALVVSLVNAEGSPLAEVSDYALPLCAGPETSVAATKSYIASLAAIVHLVAAWAQDDLLMDSLAVAPEQLRRSWDLDWSAAVPKLSAASSLFVVGRGVGLGIAQEAALKLKETSGLHAEAFSSAEVRHGPQALLKENFPALLFSQNDEAKEGVETLASDLAARGVDVMLAGASVEGVTVLPSVAAHPAIQPMLLVQSFYKLANAVAIARGFDPDRPPHLRKVTETL